MLRLVYLGVTVLSWAVAVYLLGLPLLRDRAARGNYLYGYYSLQEVYLGLPALVVAASLTALVLVPKSKRRRLIGPLFVVPMAVLFALVAFDLFYVFGVCKAGTPNRWLDAAFVSRLDNEPDPELGFVRKPNIEWSGGVRGTERVANYRADQDGFRNPPGIEKAQIVFVGDSYTEAAQVDEPDTFVQRVGAATGRSVVNLGRGAYGPQQELVVMDRYGFPREPEVVVWQLFDGNDLGDAEEFAAWVDDPDALPVAGLKQRYLQNSFFRPFLDATLRSKKGDFASFRRLDGEELSLTVRYPWRADQIVQRARGFEATAKALRVGAAECRARGVRLVVLFVPVFARVYRERLGFANPADAAKFLPDATVPPTDFGTAMAALCMELQVPFVDLYPRFREEAKTHDDLYLLRDEHLDLHGHEVVTDAVVRQIGG